MMADQSLQQLFVGLVDLSAVPDCRICGLTLDSRQVRPGYLFLRSEEHTSELQSH